MSTTANSPGGAPPDVVVGRGSFINGAWHATDANADAVIVSHDPARDFAPVFRAGVNVDHVDVAIKAARAAQPAWHALGVEGRTPYLLALKAAFEAGVDATATAIVREMGKPLREALIEAKALGDRVTLTLGDGLKRIETMRPDGVPGEARAHPQGVLAVLGPYNFPVHLMNSHIIPALATGNAVVVKPSEIVPMCGEHYARAVEAAGLPPGVFNLVQGRGDVGRALVVHDDVDGILFTGSWKTGRAINEAILDQPNKIAALEMGGKNVAVVMDDADLPQALAAVLQGAFLTTGQRCTATSRLLVHERVAEPFLDALVASARELRPGDPMNLATAFGPLATKDALDRFVRLRDNAKEAGCETLLAGAVLPGGAFVTPSIHLLNAGDAPGYLDEELFGPDLAVEIIADLDQAIARTNALPYGLANSIFTVDEGRFERFFRETRSGCVNWNRSTNNANGKLPFGGVGKSGNQRPAGVDASRFTTFPVAILKGEVGDIQLDPPFQASFRAGEERLQLKFDRLTLRHRIEALLERYRVYVDDVRGPDILIPLEQLTDLTVSDNLLEPEDLVERLAPFARIEEPHMVFAVPDVDDAFGPEADATVAAITALLDDVARDNPVFLLRLQPKQIRRPTGGSLPRSEAMLRRLYRGSFIPKEKKEPVIDLGWSDGAYMASIDDDSLVVLDAGSQIASVGLGFSAGTFLRALDDGILGDAIVENADLTAIGADTSAADDYAKLLTGECWAGIRHVSFTAGGAEANEKAFDLCRLHGPGGKRLIAFEGSFHGRTLVSLHGTWNKAKRAPFEFKGYEATFVPFPRWADPREEPPVSAAWIASWTAGEAPTVSDDDVDLQDPLVKAEVDALLGVKAAIAAGDVCCVIAEPMQGEGGDNYATARFFNGLRALTRGLGVPLVFDEVQMGFGTGGPFWWHSMFNLQNAQGQKDGPDCVTTAKKAQLGACLSVWPDPRPAPPHVVQLLRGRLHAEGLLEENAHGIQTEVQERLWALALDYPALVMNPRNIGWVFAFDLPSPRLANQLIAQRFYRGFMAYIAGEKTCRFRLNAAWDRRELDLLFRGLREGLSAIAMKARGIDPAKQREAMESYSAPRWEEGASATMGESARQSGGPFAKNYDALSEDPPVLLRWMTHLPRGPLEKVCDRVLAMEGQFDDDVVDAALLRLTGIERAWAQPTKVVDMLRRASEDIDKAPQPIVAYEELTAQIGMEPVRLIAEILGARVVVLNPDEWADYSEQIVGIEDATYESGRRDSEDDLRRMVQGEGGVGVILVRYTDVGERVLGYAFGGPVEQYKSDGPRDDAMNGRNNTFYSSNITVASSARGAGLGRRLKGAQVMRVAELTRPDGSHRYHYMTGRNRVGLTKEMGAINRLFGAYAVEHFRGNQYGDLSGQALYYRIPLRRPRCPTALPAAASHSLIGRAPIIDWASGVQAPLGHRHPRLVRALLDGEFTRMVGTKLTLSNWATPDIVRYAETLMHLGPKGLAHTYFTSGRAELVDKCIRMLRVKRKDADVVIGLERQYVGHTTAAARSLSDPAGEQQPYGWFDWPRVPHPSEVGTDAAVAAIRGVVDTVGADRVLGVFVELVGERSGYILHEDFQVALNALKAELGIPLVAVETASSLGRLAPNLWASDGIPLSPSAVLWYAGGQLGHLFVDDAHYVDTPLTLISTWDGDEISIQRAHHHLLEARSLLTQHRGAAFARAVDDAHLPGKRHGGGLWQVVDVGDEARADAIRKGALRRGLRLAKGLPGRLVLAPPLCVVDDDIKQGLARLEQAMREVG